MSATPSIQSSAPTFGLATLRSVLAELTEQYPDREWRLVKAANIVAVRNMERYPYGGIWFVQSESQADKTYTIVPTENGDTCDCQDYARRGGPCKHALAVELYTRCERRDAEQSDPTDCPVLGANMVLLPQRAYSDDARFECSDVAGDVRKLRHKVLLEYSGVTPQFLLCSFHRH